MLRRQAGKHDEAVADWTAAISMLAMERGPINEQMKGVSYHQRAVCFLALGKLDNALQDFRRFAELQPESPIPHAELARVYFAQHKYDQFTASLLEAIRLNRGDAGKNYEPTSDRQMSAEAIKHGEKQVNQMLKDRPALAEHVAAGDQLWTWVVRKFAGEDTGILVDWNSTDPSPFESDAGKSTDSGHAQIRVRDVKVHALPQGADPFEHLWIRVVFELNNVAEADAFNRFAQQAVDGQISREEYICAKCRIEDFAQHRTRAFYVRFFLPWLRSKNLSPTLADQWFCYQLPESDDARQEYWRTLPHWGYHSVWFDLLRAAGEFQRGEYALATTHLDLVELHKDSLTAEQLSRLNYCRGQLSNRENANGQPVQPMLEESAN